MTTSNHPILEYRGAIASDESALGHEAEDAREIFAWLFVSLICVPLFFGLLLVIGSVLR